MSRSRSVQRLLDLAASRRWPLIVAGLAVLSAPLLALRSSDSGSGAALLVLLPLLVVFLVLLGLNLAGRDPDVDQRALDVAPDPLTARLLARWLQRSKHFRFVGALAGGILGLAFSDNGLGSVLPGLVAGIAVGGAAAEIRVRRDPPPASRLAHITSRRLGDYVSRTDGVALAILVTISLSMIGAAVVSDSQSALLGPGVAALLAAVVTVSMQRYVVLRQRPALPAELRNADDLMRRLAATQGFTRPAIAFAILMMIQGLATFDVSTTTTLLTILLLLLAIAWYVSSRQSRSNLMAMINR